MKIGPLEIPGSVRGPLALAPMDNVTDMPFRLLCRRYGADLLYSEFVQGRMLLHNGRRSRQRLIFSEDERPIGIQIYGSDPEELRRTVAIVEEAGPDFIDLNAGCWARKIAGRGDGAGLLRDLDAFRAAVSAVVQASTLPVTVKTRLGWDQEHIVILEAARMVEDCGACALTVHCRTREQGYSGQADWRWLEKIRQVITIPLVGNGDIRSPQDVKRVFETGCDAVMIGRAAIQAPWIFAQSKHYLETGELLSPPGPGTRVGICRDFLQAICAHRGEPRGIREFRKYYAGYLGDIPGFSRVRPALMQATTLAEVNDLLDQMLREADREIPEAVYS